MRKVLLLDKEKKNNYRYIVRGMESSRDIWDACNFLELTLVKYCAVFDSNSMRSLQL